MAGRADATMVPSTTARKIGSRIGGKIRHKEGQGGSSVQLGVRGAVLGVIAVR
jgi:hypothetical protein